PAGPPPTAAVGRKPLTAAERRAMLALVAAWLLVTLFWAAYDQQGNTILLWAEDFTERSIDLRFWRGEIPSTWFLSLNPLMIFLLTPLIVRLWAWQGPRQPLPISKMAFGCLCVALANVVLAAGAWTASGKASVLWLVGFFTLPTICELYLAPLRLAPISPVAPPRLPSNMVCP